MLKRRLNLLQAISLNTSMMVGIGPFLTIPLVVAAMRGPFSLWIWLLGAVVAIADGLVWSELAATFPGSGGTYHYYDAVYGDRFAGRLLKFLFIWQFLFSAPLELASGAIGAVGFVEGLIGSRGRTEFAAIPLGSLGTWHVGGANLAAMVVMAAVVLMAYRRVDAAGRTMVLLWLGMLATVLWVTASGFLRFDPRRAFVSQERWLPDAEHLKDAGMALGMVMYTYLGYYQVAYLSDEVERPERTVPRSILLSVLIVAAMYLAMNVALLGAIPWEVLDADAFRWFMDAQYGRGAALAITGLIVWTALAGTFAAMVSYARVPYAAARAGHFFCGLAAVHPKGDFPHRSLLLVGAAAIVACLADLETVISALMTSRVLIQFVGQIATVVYLRARPESRAQLRFRMWLYPLPALVALAGWLYVLGTSSPIVLGYGLGSMVLGGLVFLVWDGWRDRVASA